ncbi:MAG TPA: adenylate/guanylate cyclase domain-containing protein [Candidatus Sulfotelmatobacter sp.]|nr:adenylate/guanylate cyclase domain-containing protein [Candidatus Sulfotelmatobacter sp.]
MPPDAPRLPVEGLKTAHRLLAAFDKDGKGLEWLHGDLYDSRVEVARSALDAVAVLASPRSFVHVARVLAGGNEELQAAAVRALGRIRNPGSVRALVDLLKTARGEGLRREILDALASAVPKDRELAGLVHKLAHAPLASAAARAHAVGLLLRLRGEAALNDVLLDSREETVDQVLRSAAELPALVPKAVDRYAPQYESLSQRSRATLVSLALSQDLGASPGVLQAALSDPVDDVRRAVYAALATAPHHAKLLPQVVEGLLGKVESSAVLEEEVQEAIDRMARIPDAAAVAPAALCSTAMNLVGELFRKLREEGRHIGSESHELGWLMMRSKEYVEYYCEEEFKAALLRYLKGASTDTENELLKRLKATAVRVEVRHFDGYTALAEIIKNPRRTGMALVARELAIAKPGKGLLFWRLIRAIRLARVVLTPAVGAASGSLLKEIYSWARQERLFRLAEAALLAFARVDPKRGTDACNECLVPPLPSKVLAIASLHLLREISPGALEPSAARLLSTQDDPYITLNAVEALFASPSSASGDLARSLLTRLSLATSREMVESLCSFLGEKISLDIMDSLKDMYAGGDAMRKSAALAIIGRRIAAGLMTNRDGTIEFLYRVLRGSEPACRRAAGALLWRLGDDYAPEVMRDFLSTGSAEEVAETLRSLQGILRPSLLQSLAPLLASESPHVQEALRELLLAASEEQRAGVLELALRFRGSPTPEEAEPDLPEGAGGPVDFRTERKAYQFEREYVQELVILFTDIQGYSKKAQLLSPQQLSGLIQDYEKILLSLMEAHRGELVKRMGDGHLFVFLDPLSAVLAGIRLQKSLRRFNRYREENARVVIRVGAHYGKVVRKEQGDVLGHTVNIASRLESAAQPGSVLVSEQVHEKVKDYVHAREIGQITVKNISEPIRVYEPYEVALDLPASLDPLKGEKVRAASAGPKAGATAAHVPPADSEAPSRIAPVAVAHVVPVDREVLAQIVMCFESLQGICGSALDGAVPLSPITEQVLAPWDRIWFRLPDVQAAREV